ncbi:plastid transcriptionally active 5, partial [Prunus dulcis]
NVLKDDSLKNIRGCQISSKHALINTSRTDISHSRREGLSSAMRKKTSAISLLYQTQASIGFLRFRLLHPLGLAQKKDPTRLGGPSRLAQHCRLVADFDGEKSDSGEGSSSRAIEFDHIQEEIEEVSAVPEVKEKNKSRNALRKGSEGEEVRAMQEALQKLGFYWGEEDMEFSSFSSGTERAVMTWQEDTNGAAVTSATEISEVQQTLVKEGVTEVEVSEHRVFLLGENRWEDSSRLSRN